MKLKLSLLSLLLLTISFCFVGEEEKLPEIPWRAIAESQHKPFSNSWKTDVSDKLFGNYSKSDSMMVQKAILELNRLTTTIQMHMSPCDQGNLEIYVLDSTNRSDFKSIISLRANNNSTYCIRYTNEYNFRSIDQAINLKSIPEASKQNFLTNSLAFVLYPVYWSDQLYYKKNQNKTELSESIYRSIDIREREKLFLTPLKEFDVKLLKAVYSPDFEKKLMIARIQFKPDRVIPEWLQVNPYSFLLLPFLLLILLVIGVYMKISKRLNLRVLNRFWRFNINVIVPGFFLAIILSLYLSLSYDLRYNQVFFSQLTKNTLFGAMAIFFIGMPTMNLLRSFEIIIHKNTHRKLLRTASIFLSTGLLPFSAFVAFYLYINYRYRPILLSNADIKILSYIFLGCMVVAAFRALISYFILNEKELILENETKLSNLRELKSRAELNALHSRINPHFLYNSLNSIAGLAHEDADKTEHMALSLSKLFRYSINKDQSDWTTLKEEMEMVRIYLDVEKVRFDDRLSYSVELPKALEEHKIPRFMIQPLVENAVKHGISKSVGNGQIRVVVTQEGRKISVAISDSGPAFPNDLAPGFGIQSIYDKLEILYQDKFEMKFINSPSKKVLITLT